MRRPWVFIGIILLVAGILFEEKHRAETMKHRLHPDALTNPADELFVVQENNFYDYVDLWGDPWVKANEPHLKNNSSLAVANSAMRASAEKFQPRVGDKNDPVVTVRNQQLDYNLLNFGGFKLSVDLKPAYATPEAILPNRIDPGISGSFSF
jgi:hypothetical protein